MRRGGAVSPPEETLFNGLLVLGQPGQVLIKMFLVKGGQAQEIAGGVAFGQPDGAQAGALVHEPGKDLPQGQLAGAPGPQGLGQPQALRHRL